MAISGATAAPGAKGVPVEVRLSAGVEFTAAVIPIDFDERYLRVARVEKGFDSGVALVDNRDEVPGNSALEGHLVLFSGLVNTRRLAAAGEEIRAGTIYFDVLDAASEVSSTTLRVTPVTSWWGPVHAPWIGVQVKTGTGSEYPVVREEVAPFAIQNCILRLVADRGLFLRGDANDDGAVDLSDAASTLSFLFQGGSAPPCPDAADANDDGRLDVSDPILLLGRLFLGERTIPEPASEPGQDPTLDALGCRGGT